MPDPIWWSTYDKAKKALGGLPEPLPFLVFCRDRLVMIGTHEYVMFCAGMLVERLRGSFVKISSERPHYQPVVNALEQLGAAFKTVNDEITKADDKNKAVVEAPSADA